MIPFIGFNLLKQGNTFSKKIKILYGFLSLFSIFAGIMIQSDALKFAWAISFCLIFILSWSKIAYTGRIGNWKSVFIYVLIPIVTISIFLLIVQPFYIALTDKIDVLYGDGGEGSVRIDLWRNAAEAIRSSFLLGLGPGAFSGIKGPFLGTEAHNTILDWGMSSGVIGMFIFIALLLWVGWKAIIRGNILLITAMVAIIVFSLFHYVLRNPIFWFYLVVIATMDANLEKSNHVSPCDK
jgi:O-antigen ligase